MANNFLSDIWKIALYSEYNKNHTNLLLKEEKKWGTAGFDNLTPTIPLNGVHLIIV